jgi:lipopolysaccharide biosynthesis glycosyltransferase
VDHAFSSQLAAALASLRASQVEPYEVIVLHGGLDEALRARIAGDGPVRWVEVPAADVSGLPFAGHVSPAATFRIPLARLLPEALPRVLYLDVDVVVRHPLGPLWRTELAGRGAAAVRDAGIPWAGSPGALPWRELRLPPTAPYFNSGVLLVDLEAWRRRDVPALVHEVSRAHRLAFADQCALNAALDGDIAQLHPRWNVQSKHLVPCTSMAPLVEDVAELDEALADPAVVHFTTGPLGRPWASRCQHPFRDAWFEALDRTPWAGWRPVRRGEVLHRLSRSDLRGRLVRRLHETGRVLVHGT